MLNWPILVWLVFRPFPMAPIPLKLLLFGTELPNCCWVPIAIPLALTFGPLDVSLPKWLLECLFSPDAATLISCLKSFNDAERPQQTCGRPSWGCPTTMPNSPNGGNVPLRNLFPSKDWEARPVRIYFKNYCCMTLIDALPAKQLFSIPISCSRINWCRKYNWNEVEWREVNTRQQLSNRNFSSDGRNQIIWNPTSMLFTGSSVCSWRKQDPRLEYGYI